MLEATVGEWGAVEPFGRGRPGQCAVQAVVVVVGGVGHHGGLGGGQVREVLAVQDLGLEDGPERLDLAVGPGRVDLGADVTHR